MLCAGVSFLNWSRPGAYERKLFLLRLRIRYNFLKRRQEVMHNLCLMALTFNFDYYPRERTLLLPARNHDSAAEILVQVNGIDAL